MPRSAKSRAFSRSELPSRIAGSMRQGGSKSAMRRKDESSPSRANDSVVLGAVIGEARAVIGGGDHREPRRLRQVALGPLGERPMSSTVAPTTELPSCSRVTQLNDSSLDSLAVSARSAT